MNALDRPIRAVWAPRSVYGTLPTVPVRILAIESPLTALVVFDEPCYMPAAARSFDRGQIDTVRIVDLRVEVEAEA